MREKCQRARTNIGKSHPKSLAWRTCLLARDCMTPHLCNEQSTSNLVKISRKSGQKVDVAAQRLLLLEGSASIRTAPSGRANERKGGEKPTQSDSSPVARQEAVVCAILDTRDSPQDIPGHLDLNVVSLRPIAIVPATPSTLDGLCGPEQRNGVGSSFELRKDARPPSTVYVWLVVPLHRRNSREDLRPFFGEETLQRSHFFACTAKSEALTLLRVSHQVWL